MSVTFRWGTSKAGDLELLLTLRRPKLPLLLLLLAPHMFLACVNLLTGFGGLAIPMFGLLGSQISVLATHA